MGLWPGKGTYVAGLSFDAGDGEDTLLLLNFVAVFTIDVLWGCSGKVWCIASEQSKTYGSFHLGLQSTLGELVHCARDLA